MNQMQANSMSSEQVETPSGLVIAPGLEQNQSNNNAPLGEACQEISTVQQATASSSPSTTAAAASSSSNNCMTRTNIIGPLISTNKTRIVYYVDNEETPYMVTLDIPHSNIKLSDFKAAVSLPRPHYKFFFKNYDPATGLVVKEEIFDDDAFLPIFEYRVVAWLVSTEGSTVSDSTNSQCPTEISATGRINKRCDRNGLVNSHGQSFGNKIVNETEPLITSRNGGNHSAPRRQYKHSHGSKYSNGGRFHGGNSYYYHDHHNHHNHSHYLDSSVMTSDMESTSFVDSDDDDDDDDDLLDTGVDDDNDYDDYTSRVSTTTEETSVSRQYQSHRNRRRRQKGFSSYNRNRMSRTSSLSSITESTMSLNCLTVTLNLDTVSYLGISLVGQTSKNGDVGIYVSSILKGGAVALDGRIGTGDMILQVNDINLENLTNDEAVEVIREAVKKPGPIKLLVAKCWNSHPKGHFTIPRSEPVRPIDPGAWVAHTEAARAKFTNPDNFPINLPSAGNFINPISSSLQEQERSTNLFDAQTFSSFTSPSNSYQITGNNVESNTIVTGSPNRNSFKSGQNQVPSLPTTATSQTISSCVPLTIESDLEEIACAIAQPNSGLDIRDRMWLKISIPNAFIGSDVVDWLFSSVPGLHNRKDAKKLASKLLKEGFICHTILKSSFSEKCYYVFSERLQQINKSDLVEGNATDLASIPQPMSTISNQPSLPGNFDEKFSNALRLKNEHFEISNLSDQTSVPIAQDNCTNRPLKSRLPFMYQWDDNSEIRNYGLFGPQPEHGISASHSGGNRSTHDQYQSSDEQTSQKSDQSILYNARVASTNMKGATSTVKSSGSSGSNAHQNSNSMTKNSSNPFISVTNNNGVLSGGANLINHHYEDLQMNPITGNLMPTISLGGNSNGLTNRHVEGNEALDLSNTAIAPTAGSSSTTTKNISNLENQSCNDSFQRTMNGKSKRHVMVIEDYERPTISNG